MRIDNKAKLVDFIDFFLSPKGFMRVKDDWYLDNQDCLTVIGIGKSKYGGQFSIVLGFFLKEIIANSVKYPPFHLCNFKINIKFVVNKFDLVNEALNLENSLKNESRVDILQEAINTYAVPYIVKFSSKEIIAHEIINNEDFEIYCDLDLKIFLQKEGYLDSKDLKI